MSSHRSSRHSPRVPQGAKPQAEERLRIIGGSMRGRRLLYSGDQRTRPMKDRVRQAVFNLLGKEVVGTQALDLFAGTGALGLEAISRGASSATLIEQHVPTARIIEQNIAELGIDVPTHVVAANVFAWVRQQRWEEWAPQPWTVFCSPPFSFYVDRLDEMLGLLELLEQRAPPGSWFVVEADSRFDMQQLARFGDWDIREYPPAVVAVQRT